MGASDISAAQGDVNIALERALIALEKLRGILVEGIVGVWLEEEKLEPEQNGGEGEHGVPVLAEDIKTDIALKINVGMVDQGVALHLGRFVGIVLGDLDSEIEGRGGVVSFLGLKYKVESHEIIRVRKGDTDGIWGIELVYVFLNTNLTGALHRCAGLPS